MLPGGLLLLLPLAPAAEADHHPHDGRRVFHAAVNGSDANAGLSATAPLRTLCACVGALQGAGDECRLHAGTYEVGEQTCNVTGLRGTREQPVVVTAAGDGPVLVDGTLPISGPWVKEHRSGLYAAGAPAATLQLFVDGEMQVLARYPNARWDDKSMFLANENWLKSRAGGTHNLTTGQGVLKDAGACTRPADCCRFCNTHDLAGSGINATGALAVVNLWKCDTGIQRVTRHVPGRHEIEYEATWVGTCDSYKGGLGRYYLEGTRELLDMGYEWLYDTSTSSVFRTAAPPPEAEVRGRVSEFSVRITDSVHVTIANISFHATAITAGGRVSNIRFEGLDFEYPAISRRSLGQTTPPVAMALWSDQPYDGWGGGGNHSVDDVSVKYSDGPALLLHGNFSSISDSSFEWCDWTAVGGVRPIDGARVGRGKADDAKTIDLKGDGLHLRRLSFSNNGAAQSTNAQGHDPAYPPPLVELCHFQSQLAMQDDGAFVEGGGKVATHYSQNWCTDTGKAGLRWDGYYSEGTGRLRGGVMTENVVWNASSVIVKGNNHQVSFNTIFDGSDIGDTNPFHDRPR
eukprot:SAG22_NODE_483_length_9925_cov_3.568186_5_plen_573_part_00